MTVYSTCVRTSCLIVRTSCRQERLMRDVDTSCHMTLVMKGYEVRLLSGCAGRVESLMTITRWLGWLGCAVLPAHLAICSHLCHCDRSGRGTQQRETAVSGPGASFTSQHVRDGGGRLNLIPCPGTAASICSADISVTLSLTQSQHPLKVFIIQFATCLCTDTQHAYLHYRHLMFITFQNSLTSN